MAGDARRIGRRTFLAASGRTVAAGFALRASAARAQVQGAPRAQPRGPAANRVRLAVIGFGARGTALARSLLGVQGAEVVGVADLYEGRLQRARELFGESLPTTRDWRTLLDRADLDAVIVATPDHWHARMTEQALSAGKDVYCECPVVRDAAEGKRLLAAAVERKRIVQGGGAWISSPVFAAAREMVTTGRLGRVTLVRAAWDTASSIAAWQAPFPPDASPETIDFAAFEGRTPARPFDPYRFFRWRCYREYGSGLAGARFAPQLTAIQWLLGEGAPSSVTATGALLRWKDGREVPDTLNALLSYSKGTAVTLSASLNGAPAQSLHLIGTQATIAIDDRGLTLQGEGQTEPYTDAGESWPKEYRDWFYMIHGMTQQGQVRGAPAPDRVLERFELPADASLPPTHLTEFVECVRFRRQPKESLELAVQAALAAQSADRAAAKTEAG